MSEKNMKTLKQIIERRHIELSKELYTASRVAHNQEIVEIGPSVISPCLELIEDGSVQNTIVVYELLASLVEIIENNKDNSLVQEIIRKIGGIDIWEDAMGSDKFELILNWWRGLRESDKTKLRISDI